MPFQERQIYLPAYKRFAMITVQTRHTSDDHVLPTIYRGGKWTDGTPFTDEENATAKLRFVEIETLRRPAPRPMPNARSDASENWPEAPPW